MLLTHWLRNLHSRLQSSARCQVRRNLRRGRQPFSPINIAAAVQQLEDRLLLSSVTTTANSGAGSLRQAILDANATPGPQTITFAIGGGGHQVITPLSALPAITNSVTVDGTTQPGYSGTPLIEISGTSAGAGADGLLVSTGSNSTIRGLDIHSFFGQGINIEGAASNNPVLGVTVEDCYLGVDATGNFAQGNSNGILVVFADGVQIRHNLISGNMSNGLAISSDSNVVISGNYIGTDVTGTHAIGTSQQGIWVDNSSDVVIGTNGDGTGDAAEGNVISGREAQAAVLLSNTQDSVIAGNEIGVDPTGEFAVGSTPQGILMSSVSGIRIGTNGDGTSDMLERNVISGNMTIGIAGFDVADSIISGDYIGVDASGSQVIGNSGYAGIGIQYSSNVRIGVDGQDADPAAERNVIAGWAAEAIGLSNTVGSTVAGNYVGVDATGTIALGNTGYGIAVVDSSNLLIGTTATGPMGAVERNVISGGNQTGVIVVGTGQGTDTGTVVAGNFIGTDASGTNPLGNASAGVILAGGATGTQIRSNVISANGQYGIWLADQFLPGLSRDQISITGNSIGTDATGTLDLANGADGILLDDNDQNVTIGGTAIGQANTIAFNHGNGVTVMGDNSFGDSIRGNAIYANTGLGIDLGDDGVTANDPTDADASPNEFQNFPVLALVEAGTSTHIVGTINSTANVTLTVDFYSNSAADPSGNGQGRVYLGSTVVTTDGSGYAVFNVTLAAATSVGDVISATATDAGNNTSEFSADLTAVADGALIDTSTLSTVNVVEGANTGNVVLATFTDEDPSAALSSYTVNVNWGGTPAASGTLSVQLVARFDLYSTWQVVGNVTYPEAGTSTAQVTVNDAGGSVLFSNKTTFSVAEAPLTDTTVATTDNVLEGNSTGTIVLATFSDANPLAVNDYTLSVAWGGALIGSGTASIQLVSRSATASSWKVVGSATYAEPGNYLVQVTVNDADGASCNTNKTTVSVADAPLTDTTPMQTLGATAGINSGTLVLATFTDGDPSAPLSDFTPIVNWGGAVTGTPSFSVQLVSRTASVSNWQVVGSVTYPAESVFTITVTVNDVDGATFTTSNTKISTINPAILLLDPSGAGALTDSGNGTICVGANGEIIVASTNAAAVIVSGNGKVSAPEFDLRSTTGTQVSGNGKIIGTVDHGVAASEVADILASLVVPTAPVTQFSAVNVSGNTTVTLQPGTYIGGIKAWGNAKVTLAAGTYYLQGGGFSVSANASVTGSGVFIYNAPQSASDVIGISGNGSVVLTAPTSGDYQGVAIFQARSSTAPISIAGNGGLKLTGTMYAASAKVNVSGNGVLTFTGSYGRLICADLNDSGNGTVTAGTSSSSSSSHALMSLDGSADSSSSGTLLGQSGSLTLGLLTVAVDGLLGDAAADEEARIEDAIASLNSDLAPYGVRVVEVTGDLAAAADVHIHMADTSVIGGVGQGVLGVTAGGNDITLIAGWNWFTGADASMIGAGQYDFQTVVTHELGHATGLGHSADNGSVMYRTLAAGDARHDLTAADLAVLDSGDDSQPEPLMAAAPATSEANAAGTPDAGDTAVDNRTSVETEFRELPITGGQTAFNSAGPGNATSPGLVGFVFGAFDDAGRLVTSGLEIADEKFVGSAGGNVAASPAEPASVEERDDTTSRPSLKSSLEATQLPNTVFDSISSNEANGLRSNQIRSVL